jgi:hypothetical protein
MTATWRTKVQFELSQAEAERLYDLVKTLLDIDHDKYLTDDERQHVEVFLRLLRNPADPPTTMAKYAPWRPPRHAEPPEAMPF